MGTGTVCNLCQAVCKNMQGLAMHIRHQHEDYSSKRYYDEFLSSVNKCPICDEEKRFLNLVRGYDKACDIHLKKYRPSCWEYYRIKFDYDIDRCRELARESNATKLSDYQSTLTDDDKRRRSCFCVEYWIEKGYTESQATEIIRERNAQLSRRSVVARRNMPKELLSQVYPEFWINKGYSSEEAKERSAKAVGNQKGRCTLEWYVQRYGQEEGKLRHDEYRESRKQTLKRFIDLYGTEEGTERYTEYRNKQADILRKNNNRGWSNISQEVFWDLFNNIKDILGWKDVIFATNKSGVRDDHVNKEYRVVIDQETGRSRRVDFYIPKLNVIIEYDSNFFHDPDKDIIRENEIKQVLCDPDIWRINEDEYREDKLATIEKYTTMIRNKYEAEIETNKAN